MKKEVKEEKLNLIPFFALALSNCQSIHRDIDKVYKRKKESYYTCAIESKFYDCIMAQELSLLTEEYFKKCIGILEYQDIFENPETEQDIISLFKKAYKKVYLFFKRYNKEDIVDIKDFYKEYLENRIDSMSEDEVNSNGIAAIFFTIILQLKHVINQELITNSLFLMWKHYEGWKRITLDIEHFELKEEVLQYCKKYSIKIFEEILRANKPCVYAYLFDLEHLSYLSIFSELQFTNEDIKEIVLSYVCEKNYRNYKGAIDEYMHHALFVLGMCRAYKDAKNRYFYNNKETMYIEMNNIKKELKNCKSLLNEEKRKNKELLNFKENYKDTLLKENERLEKENQKLKNQINEMQDNSKELYALREYIFKENYENIDDNDNLDQSIEVDSINKLEGVIVGGHPNWQNKLKEILTQWKFINVDINNVNKELIKGCEIIIFNIEYLKHSLYYSVINLIKNEDVFLGYISNTNIEIALKKIYDICKDKL